MSQATSWSPGRCSSRVSVLAAGGSLSSEIPLEDSNPRSHGVDGAFPDAAPGSTTSSPPPPGRPVVCAGVVAAAAGQEITGAEAAGDGQERPS